MSTSESTVPSADTLVPQYAGSTAPAVLAYLRERERAYAEFHQAALAFSAKYGDDPKQGYYVSRGWGGARSVTGIPSSEAPKDSGRWKRLRHTDGWAPFKNNPVSAEMAAIRLPALDVPGLAETYAGGTNADFSTRVFTPNVFIEGGIAYMGLPGLPVADQDANPFGSAKFDRGLWTEIKGSEYLAARERLAGATR